MPKQNKKKPLIALSLGGGGAKTFAHLGILDALKDEGIKINFTDWRETFTGYFNNNKIEKFYKKGYEAAIKEMPKIKKLIK